MNDVINKILPYLFIVRSGNINNLLCWQQFLKTSVLTFPSAAVSKNFNISLPFLYHDTTTDKKLLPMTKFLY